MKALRDAIRGTSCSRVSPSSWQSMVRSGWLQLNAGASTAAQQHVVLDAGHKALAGHQLALAARQRRKGA